MTLGALTGPSDTALRIGVEGAPGCGAVTESKHVQIKIPDGHGKLVSVQNLHDVAVTDGAALVKLDRVDGGHAIDVLAKIKTESSPRTFVLRGTVAAQLRPDLVVTPSTRRCRRHDTAVDVVAEIAEMKGDTGATAQVALAGTIGPLAGPSR